MKKCILLLPIFCWLLLTVFRFSAANELYIITTREGSTIIVRDYRFTDKYVEFTTANGLPGYIKKEEFVKIGNMIGVPSRGAEPVKVAVTPKERAKTYWLSGGAVFLVLFVVLVVYLSGRKKNNGREETDIYYGRQEKEPTTQGHLSFAYRGFLGRTATWTIAVRSAYEEDGILYVEGFCTATDRKKKFRADRVVGPVTDMSSDHHAPMEHFFVAVKQET